ncbi:hypothetical protein ABZW03_14740 [Kitasatospora sp. NPDC004799]|uniref:hypothetical protein n=1 Tax=Kitasatospora sp. NPDC004799 TaxID=3154460 RepID=UPI0033B49D6A
MTVGRRRIITAVPGTTMPAAPMPGVAVTGAADPALTVRRYIDHALICSACCRRPA